MIYIYIIYIIYTHVCIYGYMAKQKWRLMKTIAEMRLDT